MNKQFKDLLQATIEMRDAQRKAKLTYSVYLNGKKKDAEKKVDKLLNELQPMLQIKPTAEQPRLGLFSTSN